MPDREPVVSVIIPTLDRPSLAAAVESARRQEVSTRILVVNDSGSAMVTDVGDAVVIETPGRTGAAAARNLALARVDSEFFAFLDDDDEWLPGHLAAALSAFAEQPAADLYFCRGLVLADDSARIEPVVQLGNRTLGEYLFEPAIWRSRNRRVLTPTLVARAPLASIAMDPELRASQDTWWLLTAEAQGAQVVYRHRVGVVVHADTERDLERRTSRDALQWARRIDSQITGAGQVILVARQGRDAARSGRPVRVISFARDARQLGPITRWLPVIALQVVVALLVAGIRRTRR